MKATLQKLKVIYGLTAEEAAALGAAGLETPRAIREHPELVPDEPEGLRAKLGLSEN